LPEIANNRQSVHIILSLLCAEQKRQNSGA
jgi:hypothetical protein